MSISGHPLQNAKHLVTALNEHYIVSQYWKGGRYRGMTLDWDYKRIEVHISMLDYVVEALIFFQHNAPKTLQDRPHPHIKPKYGKNVQYDEEKYSSPYWENMGNGSSKKSHAPSYIMHVHLIAQC